MPNMAFSRAEQLKDLIKESRKKFVKQAVEDGMEKEEAKDTAKKLIGVTWDVGHINMMRKAGYKEKDVIKETTKIAPVVKHVHLTDNFGFTDSHLGLGMGNVPMKKMMEKIKKEGYDGRAIVEAGNFAAQFKTSPHPFSVQALDAPIYSSGPTSSWGDVSAMQGSYSFYGSFLPQQHFAMYGAGFSGLPPELGGGKGGAAQGRRFSGTPME